MLGRLEPGTPRPPHAKPVGAQGGWFARGARVPQGQGLLGQPAVYLSCAVVAMSAAAWAIGPQLFWSSGLGVFEHGQWWRAVSALFVHRDVDHLVSNLAPFVVFGWLLRRSYGLWAFPVVPLLLGAATNVLVAAVCPPQVALAGLSGAVYAMIGLWAALQVRKGLGLAALLKAARMAGVFAMFLLPRGSSASFSTLAHAAGFLGGALSAVVAGDLFEETPRN